MLTRLLTVLAVGAATLLLMLVVSSSPGSAPPRYIAIGDSLAAGLQPDSDGVDGPSRHGYAESLGRRLRRGYPRLRTHPLSCGGAHTRTLGRGGAGCPPRGEAGQPVQA